MLSSLRLSLMFHLFEQSENTRQERITHRNRFLFSQRCIIVNFFFRLLGLVFFCPFEKLVDLHTQTDLAHYTLCGSNDRTTLCSKVIHN